MCVCVPGTFLDAELVGQVLQCPHLLHELRVCEAGKLCNSSNSNTTSKQASNRSYTHT